MIKNKILVVIPAYNEGKSIKRVIDNLKENYSNYDYVIVNDGSKDDTIKICKENHYNYIDLPVNLGLAGAFQTGLKYAYAMGYEYAIQYDGDGQHRAEYIKDIFLKMEQGYDIVIGSRFVSEKKPFSLRMVGSFIISNAMRLTTGQKVKDPTSGMRMFNKEMIKVFAQNMNYGPEPDTISYMLKQGAKVSEVQVEMDERVEGTSYLTFAKSILYMLRMSVSILFIQNFRKNNVLRKRS